MGALRAACLFGVLAAGCGGQPTALPRCSHDGECPVHQSCDPVARRCATGCFTTAECMADQVCNPHGRCLDVPPLDSDGGADLSSDPPDLFKAPPDSNPPDLPPPDLMPPPGCGNGVIEGLEQCDQGSANSDVAAAAATCTTQCRRRASCGTLQGASGAAIDPGTGHCYVAWAESARFAVAQQRCEERGGALPTITSAAEDAVVRGLAGTLTRWLNMASLKSGAANLKWLNGEPKVFTAWAPGEPTNGSGSEDCVQLNPTANGWNDIDCGWPTSGLLPPSATSTGSFVCESSCGNSTVEAGEECDPPGPTCTSRCQSRRACGEPGGVVAETNGHCYFSTGTASNWGVAHGACPAGTHLATLSSLAESAAALKAVTADAWFALKSVASGIDFAWAHGPGDFNPKLFHGFAAGEPNSGVTPTCVRMTTVGWKDAVCTGTYVALCERD